MLIFLEIHGGDSKGKIHDQHLRIETAKENSKIYFSLDGIENKVNETVISTDEDNIGTLVNEYE